MAETISDTQLRLETFIKDNYPTADVAPGTVLSELLIKLNASLQNLITNDIADVGQTNAIATVLAATTDTYSPTIDAIASNYNTSRSAGKKATGKIKVILTGDNTYFLAKGFTFYQPVLKLNYVTETDYTLTADAAASDELNIVAEGSLFYALVPVVGESVGAEYQVSHETRFSLATTNSLTGFVDAYAYGNFTSGLPEDTDKELIARYQQGLTNKTLLTGKSILARLQESFPSVRQVSVVGANDSELTRSKHNAFGISTLGMADVYIRSTLGPETILITKTATQTDGVWSFSLDYNDVAGFYRIVSILPTGENFVGTIVNTQTFGFSTTGITPSNSITTNREGRFTKYQTCDVTFEYVSTATEKEFDVLIAYQPDIARIQDLFLDNDERILCADYLVKSVLPCNVSVSLKLHRKNSKVDLPVDKIKQEIYNYINTLPFGADLHISKLIDICHNYDVSYVEFPILLKGDIFTDNSTILSISSTDTLSIPTDLDLGVSPKTTMFFVDYFGSTLSTNSMSDSISIEVV